MPRSRALRVEFSKEHDAYLYKYLAQYCPSKEGRSGQRIFQRLVANEHNKWPWSVHHTWQSWRERYVKNADHFDALILRYQRKHNNKPVEGKKSAAEPMLGPSAKRAKLGAEERVPRSETSTGQGTAAQNASTNPSGSKLTSRDSREPQAAPSQVHLADEFEPTDVRPSSLPRSSSDTNTDAIKTPYLDPPALQTQHETLEIPSSSPNPPAPQPMNGEPESRSPPRALKRKERPCDPSDVFASVPPSPRTDPAAVDVGGAPVTDTVHPRAPPRIVDSLHGQVLVDRNGHVPHALPHGEEDVAESEGEEEDGARWPPPRGRTTEQQTASGPDVKVDAHHAFSQPQPLPRAEAPLEGVAIGEGERGKPHDPFTHISRPPDRRVAAALFSAHLRHDVAAEVESERREDTTRDGASPVKRIVQTATTPMLLSDLIPSLASKAFKFSAPRPSTRSPFRSELPAKKTRHPAPRPQSRTKSARHPALSRVRRQTVGHEHGNGRGYGRVPSIDLVALSHSSTSTRSHSHSSTDPLVPTRPSRWSLPAFAQPTSWMIDESEGAPSASGSVLGSGSGSPFKWVASSPAYPDIWRHARTSSLGEISAPRFMFTPSPARSITAVATDANASAPHPNAIPASPSLSITPHPPDVPLTASHGLASILARMSANHGLALSVVEAVYTRVGSLREADEVLRGMREAAEEFGEREIDKKVRGRHERRRGSGMGRGERGAKRQRNGDGEEQKRTLLRHVVASEDGEESEYSPPETSRAAMWKQQSESASYVEEGEDRDEEDEELGEDRDEEEEEGRAVEKELLGEGREGENDDEDGLPDRHHDFSQVSLENREAQELERKVGRSQFRKDVARRFV